ncbi:conserved hypothetical protein [Thiomonas arsenitoxydans]|uniref:Uncharacterized protein n=1 Tax=Thiomonas arsenitoxydans (strain DSM 22701 / CIP 110005 / 3As) TaxID=426114 RepID=D6CVL3_THIA3|nr:hypothetical protein THI_0033 [Thiomonas arsenitoxydans]CQR28469.1 conserved hypothetical protein [Thiomonas arsenitoxydans]CQR28470.1 conserved hypothetical protein [Thiomonas arsenitoxydans]CQR42806.1 conserved hypothetical protein [Thiomonas sp. CB3]VDY05221.1 conserved protein of unknown function [Thiomonas sp. Bio17B3]
MICQIQCATAPRQNQAHSRSLHRVFADSRQNVQMFTLEGSHFAGHSEADALHETKKSPRPCGGGA